MSDTQNPTPIPTTTEAWFEGRLTRHRLHPMSPDDARRAVGPRRILLPQGSLAQLVDGAAFRYLAWLELRARQPRGNHYHERKQESFYLIDGEADLHVLDRTDGRRVVVGLRSGDLVHIAPPLAHALMPLRDGSALEFAPEPFDPADTHRHIVTTPGLSPSA